MVKKSLLTILVINLMLLLPLDGCWARGFGGARMGGGGFRGGGMRGGFGGGARMGGGGFGGARNLGGFSGGARNMGGLNRGGLGAGGLAGANRNLGGLGGGRTPGNIGGLRQGIGGLPGGAGEGIPGLGGGAAGRGSGLAGGRGPAGGESRFNTPNRSQLNNFLGLPSDSGMNHLQGRPGVGDGGRVGNGNLPVVRPGAGGGGEESRGARIAAGYRNYSPSIRYNHASAIRNNFNNYNIYGRGWYTNHPGAWFATGWGVGYAWRAATWSSMGYWFGYPSSYEPIYYDYGNTVTYQGNNVYVNGQDAGTSEEYYNQASQLATTGADASVSDQGGDWMPLGVFALSQSGSDTKDAAATIQLAVNKQGILRGNFTDTKSGQTQVIQGSIDKKTQRAAFSVGDDQTDVYETGLYNLTKDEAPLLRHLGKDQTQQWLMVRLKQPSDDGDSTDNPSGSN